MSSAEQMPDDARGAGECEFCKIVNGGGDSRRLSETDRTLAFPPLRPATPGHLLLIPRRHVEDIWSLDQELAEELARETLFLAFVIRDVLRPDGLNVIQSNGAAATQTVRHLHIHLVPRWEGDSMGDIWPSGSPVSHQHETRAIDLLAIGIRDFSRR